MASTNDSFNMRTFFSSQTRLTIISFIQTITYFEIIKTTNTFTIYNPLFTSIHSKIWTKHEIYKKAHRKRTTDPKKNLYNKKRTQLYMHTWRIWQDADHVQPMTTTSANSARRLHFCESSTSSPIAKCLDGDVQNWIFPMRCKSQVIWGYFSNGSSGKFRFCMRDWCDEFALGVIVFFFFKCLLS